MTAEVTLQPFTTVHLATLARWLRQPHVAPWYPEPDANMAWAENPPEGGFQRVIVCRGTDIGYIRWQYVDRETLDSLGLHDIPENSVDADILIGELGDIGKGAGPAALVALADLLRRDPRVALIGLTTSIHNLHAHRGFAKAGFRISRQYDPNGLGQCHLMILHLRSDEPTVLRDAPR
ncbi:MAG TPA: GNAT family N-acetyltransferase [Pseudomonadales bacterium]|nr:GNAT family N-acetyltransferase [Pseudomonadales bacterium]